MSHVSPASSPRLLVVADSLEGGLGAAAMAHAQWFATHGYDVVLAAPAARPLPVSPAAAYALPGVGSAFDLPALLAAVRDLRALLRRSRPSIVHVHGVRSQLVCLLAGRLPYVTMHGAGGRVAGQGVLGSLVRVLARRVAARLAVRAYSAAPVGGRWRTLLHASPRLLEITESPVPDDRLPTMVWLGRLDEPKRPELFVQACAAAARDRPLRGLVVGDGPARNRVAATVEALGAPVELAGSVDDVAGVLAGARAVCLFSGFEGVPFAVQEAMWVGRPVVLSPLPTLRWFAGDHARWAADVDEAASALVALCDHAVAAEEGRAAARRARSLLTPDAPFPTLRADYEARLRTSR